MRKLIAVVVGLAMASPLLADYEAYTPYSEGEPEAIIDDLIDCGSIEGLLGIITEWEEDPDTGNTQIVTENGEVGAKWDKQQYEKCDSLPENVDHSATHIHSYERKGRAGVEVFCTLSTDKVHLGTAQQMDSDDESWWWAPTIYVADNMPVIVVLDEDDNEILPRPGWGNTEDSYDKTRIKNTGGKGESNPPADGERLESDYALRPGDSEYGKPSQDQTWPRTFSASTGAKVGADLDARKIEIQYQIDSSANRTADNADVDDWRLYLRSDMDTEVED